MKLDSNGTTATWNDRMVSQLQKRRPYCEHGLSTSYPIKNISTRVSPPNKNNTKERHPLFSRIDMNKDELLSREEYVLFYKKLFPSLDTNQDSLSRSR